MSFAMSTHLDECTQRVKKRTHREHSISESDLYWATLKLAFRVSSGLQPPAKTYRHGRSNQPGCEGKPSTARPGVVQSQASVASYCDTVAQTGLAA